MNRIAKRQEVQLALTDRVPYQALVDRPKLVLPGGKALR